MKLLTGKKVNYCPQCGLSLRSGGLRIINKHYYNCLGCKITFAEPPIKKVPRKYRMTINYDAEVNRWFYFEEKLKQWI